MGADDAVEKFTDGYYRWKSEWPGEEGYLLAFKFPMKGRYEAYFDDAEVVSKFVGLPLVPGAPIPVCCAPLKDFESSVFQMIDAGYKVAVFEPSRDNVIDLQEYRQKKSGFKPLP